MKRAHKDKAPAPKAEPTEPTPKIQLPDARPERRFLWGIGALVGAGMFAGGAVIAAQRMLPAWEVHAFRFINNWPDGLQTFFLIATLAPHSLWIAVAIVLVTFFLKFYRLSWQLAAATFAGYGITYMAKELISRGRPLEFFHDAAIRINETGMGYPSGHTMIITVIVLTLFPYLPRGWRWVVMALVPLMALSRVYLGVHAPLDVIGGFGIGLFVVSAIRSIPGKWREILRFD